MIKIPVFNKKKSEEASNEEVKSRKVSKEERKKETKAVIKGKDYGVYLTAKQKRQIVRELRSRQTKELVSVQNLIPYSAMFRNGYARTSSHYYSLMIVFNDINYADEDDDVHAGIFDAWCDIINSFDTSISVQLQTAVLKIDIDKLEKEVVPDNGIDDPEIRKIMDVYDDIIREKLREGNNEYVRVKYFIIGCEAKNLKDAMSKLGNPAHKAGSAEAGGAAFSLIDSLNNLSIKCNIVNGVERLKIMHDMLNPYNFEPFNFNYDLISKTGLSSKDFICPTSIKFDRHGFSIGENDVVGQTFRLDIRGDQIDDNLLRNILKSKSNIICSTHMKAIHNEAAVKMLKRKVTNLESSKVEEQMKAARKGYDIDIMPPDLVTYDNDVKKTLDNVQAGRDHMFVCTILVTIFAINKRELNATLSDINSKISEQDCYLKPIDFKQDLALMSNLPLAFNQINIECKFQTRSIAALMPFTTVEVFQTTGEQLYGGLNKLSGHIIMTDRKKLDNANGLVFGVPGGGKSFFIKKEILSTFKSTPDDILICDPESEYGNITKKLKGQVITISPSSKDFLNPMDIVVGDGDIIDDVIKIQTDYLHNLFDLMFGSRDRLTEGEQNLLDKAALDAYEDYFKNPIPERMPTLSTLFEYVKSKELDKSDNNLSSKMERYVTGSSNLFNHYTNVDISNRLVCFDINNLGEQLKMAAMSIIQNHIWHRVRKNRDLGKNTRYYMDEFHLFLREEQTAAYALEVFKRFRKYGGIPTGITQNIRDIVNNPSAETIFANSEYIVILKQKDDDARILQQTLGIPQQAMKHITNNAKGSGLLFFGGTLIPFEDNFPAGNIVYDTITTNLQDIAEQKERQKFLELQKKHEVEIVSAQSQDTAV